MSSVLNTAYNNYLTTYAPKSVTRYDAHKKSELRSVYNSIVQLNKDAPWYLPSNNKETQAYAIGLKENARSLRNTIASLGGLDDDDLLSKKTAYSTNPDVATANFVGTYKPGTASPSFTLEIQELATPQENMGRFLEKDKIGLAPNTYSFDVTINDMNYEFQFSISEEETNQEVQERLVRLINTSGIGLKSHIMESNNRTALVISSETTGLGSGQKYIFKISDEHTSKTKGATSYLGLDYVSHEATNAKFIINGENRSTTSNEFTVGHMFDVALNGTTATGETITIGLKTDMESLTDNVLQLTQGFNDFIKATSDYLQTQPKSKHAIREMNSIAGKYSAYFDSMGVNISYNGTLEVDTEKFSKSVSDDESVTDTFNVLKEFSNQLLQKSSDIALNPMNYVDRKIVAYKNPGRNFASPYTTSAYSGMMFNGYC